MALAAATAQSHIRLAQALPPRLLSFFTKFPPPQIASIPPPSDHEGINTISTAPNTSPSDPNARTNTTATLNTSAPAIWPANDKTSGKKHNPFQPFRNPRTGNWHGPHYSLRRQAELFKLAAQHNVLNLMPLSPKHPDVRAAKRLERAERMRREDRMEENEKHGVGLMPLSGKKAKGHKWERTLRGRMEERRKAMEGMPEMIREWKQKGHGRGWKKWPR